MSFDEVLKAMSGVYQDTSENRRKHRVGQHYGQTSSGEVSGDEKTSKREQREARLKKYRESLASIEAKLNDPKASEESKKLGRELKAKMEEKISKLETRMGGKKKANLKDATDKVVENAKKKVEPLNLPEKKEKKEEKPEKSKFDASKAHITYADSAKTAKAAAEDFTKILGEMGFDVSKGAPGVGYDAYLSVAPGVQLSYGSAEHWDNFYFMAHIVDKDEGEEFYMKDGWDQDVTASGKKIGMAKFLKKVQGYRTKVSAKEAVSDIIGKINDAYEVERPDGFNEAYIRYGDATDLSYDEKSGELTVYTEGKAYGDSHSSESVVSQTAIDNYSPSRHTTWHYDFRGDRVPTTTNTNAAIRLSRMFEKRTGIKPKKIILHQEFD